MKYFFILSILILSSCSNTIPNVDEEFKNNLVLRKMGNTGYTILIPKDFAFVKRVGPDFDVYEFYPKDSNAKIKYGGGIYFGNHPDIQQSNECDSEVKSYTVLGKSTDWTIEKCDGYISIQSLIEINSSPGNDYMHLFGGCLNETEIEKVIYIYTSIKKYEN